MAAVAFPGGAGFYRSRGMDLPTQETEQAEPEKVQAMKEWLPVLTAVVAAVVMLATVVYGQAQTNQQVADLAALERRIEEKVDDLTQRLARIEGYLAHHNGVTQRPPDSPAPVAMPKPVPEPPR